MSNREEKLNKFLKKTGFENFSRKVISGDASFRSYQRIFADSKTYILMDAPPPQENVRPYIKIAEFLMNNNFSAPKIFFKDEENGFLIIEDFGDELFSKILSENNSKEKELELYRLAIDTLLEIKKIKADKEIPLYSDEILNREISLFIDWYMKKILNIQLSDSDKTSFLKLWVELFKHTRKQESQLVLRDYHVSNMILLDKRESYKKVGLLDFQDALIGSPAYDLVSLLEDARRNVPENIAKFGLSYYIDNAEIENKSDFIADYNILGAQRNLKIIGIFTRLSYRDGKHSYLSMIPRVWNYLESDLRHPALEKINAWLEKIISPEQKRKIPIYAAS